MEPDKNKSISEMNMKELRLMFERLSLEEHIEDVISRLNYNAHRADEGEYPHDTMYADNIDVNTPIKDLYHKNDYFEHHGILGMHWGVRRYQNKDGSLTEAGKKRIESVKKGDTNDYYTARYLNSKGVKHLTTSELQDLVKRMQLESQYSKLNPSSSEKAQQFIKNVAATGATIASIYALTKTPLAQDLMKALKIR